ncbi:MAG: response regulator [Acidobacteriota bacterium]
MPTSLILVVDDDPDTRELYKLVFDAGEYRVVEAASVAEGFRAAASLRPDVILADWRLGDGDGFALCAALHQHGRTRHIPIIAVTGVSLSPSAVDRARQLGCEVVFTKPVELDRLVRAVGFALHNQQARLLRAAAVRIRRYARSITCDAAAPRGGADVNVGGLLSAARLREPSDVALILADDSGRYVAANDHAAELTGYDSRELTSMSVKDLYLPSQTEAGSELWRHFIAEGTQEGVFVARRRDGGSVAMHYVAIANVVPGLHLSALSPTPPLSHPLLS